MNETMTLILICGLTFLVGIGIGAAITDTIITWQGVVLRPQESEE